MQVEKRKTDRKKKVKIIRNSVIKAVFLTVTEKITGLTS